MRPVSPAGLSFLRGTQSFFIVELYTFTLSDGAIARFATSDVDVSVGGNVYSSKSLLISGVRLKLSVGVRVDEQDLKIAAHPEDTLAGAAFLAGVADGLLDGAFVARDRAFWAQPDDALTNDPVVTVRMFYGRISTITKAGRTLVELKVKSPLSFLSLDLPRNYWQPTCLWTLYDAGCTLSKSTFSFPVVVAPGATPTTIPLVGGVPNAAFMPDGIETYAFGRMLFTSGVNNNLNVALKSNDIANVVLSTPLKTVPNPGDTASISYGCSKLRNTCNVKFNNLNNFRGFDLVPPMSFSV